MNNDRTDSSGVLPTDSYSLELHRLRSNPSAMEAKSSTIQTQTFYGHAEEWIVRTLRVDGGDTVFVRHIKHDGGGSYVIPPAVMAAVNRQQTVINGIARRRGARKAMATRIAEGKPAMPTAPRRGKGK